MRQTFPSASTTQACVARPTPPTRLPDWRLAGSRAQARPFLPSVQGPAQTAQRAAPSSPAVTAVF